MAARYGLLRRYANLCRIHITTLLTTEQQLSEVIRALEQIGTDVSALMIAYAQAQAQQEVYGGNALFEVMNALEPLRFPDGHFDLVNMRAGGAWIRREQWASVLREWRTGRNESLNRIWASRDE